MKWTSTAVIGLLAPFLVFGAPIAPEKRDANEPGVEPVAPAGSYIVTLKSGIETNTSAAHIAWAGDLHRRGLVRRQEPETEIKTFDVFDFHGYAGTFDAEAISAIEASEDVRTPPTSVPLLPIG